MTENTEDDLIIYRRRLPHWRLAGSVYFVTWRLHKLQPALADPERDLIAAALRHFNGQRYDLAAYVVMPDHVHLLVRHGEGQVLQKIVHSWKSFTANQMRRKFQRPGKIWQDEYFDRIIRHDKELWEKMQYILSNPLQIWPEREDYPWAWANLEFD